MELNKLFNSFYAGKKVLITGHTGFKGSWLSILLHMLGADVFGFALDSPTKPSLYNLANLDSFVNSRIADIRNFNHLRDYVKKITPDIIIHMAAQPIVRESYISPRETYEINVMGTVNIFEAVRQTDNVKVLLNVTTDKCYENKEWTWGYREIDRLNGHDPYSNSKSCSELITSSYTKSFFSNKKSSATAIASARAGNVIGGGDWAEDRLIPDFIRSIIQNKKIIIRSPDAIRPWQYVLEPLTGYLMLCEKLFIEGDKYSGAWNFGPTDNELKSVEWIAATLCNLWGNNAGYIIQKENNYHEAGFLKLDCSKAKSKLFWQPKWKLEDALISICNWTHSFIDQEDMLQICKKQIKDYYNK
ncbi:MAG: CDP-glucose 4,6-dehydratase [Clostridiales bacterium]